MTNVQNEPFTEDVMRARIAELRPKYGLPVRAAYSALLALYDALDAAAEAEEATNALMSEADTALGLSGDVMEGTGSSEFFDVVASIQRLAERHTGGLVSDDNLIPIGLVAERLDQLEPGPDFGGPNLADRLSIYRGENEPMPEAGEATIGRLLAGVSDPDSIRPWVSRGDGAGE